MRGLLGVWVFTFSEHVYKTWFKSLSELYDIERLSRPLSFGKPFIKPRELWSSTRVFNLIKPSRPATLLFLGVRLERNLLEQVVREVDLLNECFG